MTSRKKIRGGVVAVLAAASLLATPVPVLAAPQRPVRPPAPQQIPSVPTRDLPAVDRRPVAATKRPPVAPPTWPAAGSAEVALTSGTSAVRAAGLPVSVHPSRGAPSRVRVEVMDQAAAAAAGIHGVLMRISAVGEPDHGNATVTLDYGAFARAYGGDWASRLRLVALPGCALSPPRPQTCPATPLASRNDIAARTVTASVPVGTLAAATAEPSGGAGDYTATSLQPSSTWESGQNTGEFTWSYPMRVPPAAGGPAPAVSLSYSSSAVDGRMAASNNQPGWAGEGFELAPGGFIERRYKSCADDMGGGANNTVKTGDECWATDNATLSLAGHSGELIFNAGEDRWHLRGDDGSRIERRTGPGNGDNDNEYWVVTTTNGTQYWFGRNRLPGWTSGAAETHSVLTEPVFGNHSGEPCHAGTFAGSVCTQAYRWNLDYVIDMNGNTMSLWYATASNKYARNLATSNPVAYLRDGWLTKIDYGTRSSKSLADDPSQQTAADSVFTEAAPMEVTFTVDDRCLSGCSTHDATHWTDVPWDLDCPGSTCSVTSPTFWTTKRLKQVTTRVRAGSAYRDVETWTLTHTYPDPGDGTRAGLWLDRLSHSGGAAAVPDTRFDWVQLANRVDPTTPDSRPAMKWMRIAKITTETGATISVTYSPQDCIAGGKMPDPNALQNNTFRCYPVHWQPPSGGTVLEFFNKYVVTRVEENDNTGGTRPFGSPPVVHTYTYPADGAAWHYTDADGLIKAADKTWSVWRGYATVGTTTGHASYGDTPTYSETSYFRGMNGDHLPSGTRSVQLAAVDMNGDGDTTDSADAPAVPDEDAYAGMIRRTVTVNGGAEIASQVYQPWRSAPTASRTIDGVTVEARFTGTAATHSRVALDHAPGWRTTSTATQFDTLGMPIRVDDYGDDATGTDDQCTATDYYRNSAAGLTALVKQVTVYALTCATADNPQTTVTEADVVSNVRTAYDGLGWAAPGGPVKGLPTWSAKALTWTPGAPGGPATQAVTQTGYDAQGRVRQVTDPLNRTSQTDYTPATGGPVTQITTTSPAPQLFTLTKELDPGYGVPTASTDTNGRRTDLGYDGLGRITGVWLPGRDRQATPNLSFAYLVRDDGPAVVTSAKLNAGGTYTTSYALLDGLLRARQTQSASPSGGRVVTDTFYDSLGRTLRTYGAYHDTRGGPGTTLVAPLDQHDVPNQNYTLYDAAGRSTDVVFDPYANGERWRTHTAYTGDRVDVTPPTGGTKTSTTSDARGNTTALWQYTGPNPADGITTTYTYNRKNQLRRITDGATNYWEYGYDLAGNRTSLRDPDSGTSTYEFDAAGQATAATNALNQKLITTYDTQGRRTGLYLGSISTANKRATWTYDTAYFDGTATKAKGRPSVATRWTNSGTRAYKSTVVGYTDLYQPTGVSVTIPSAETGLGGTYTFQNFYQADGSLKSSTFPASGDLPDEGLTLDYDTTTGLATTLDSLYDVTESSLVTATAYDALSRVTQYTLYTGRYSQTGPHMWLNYSRELDTGRLSTTTAVRETGSPTTLASVAYTYDPAGDITRIADTAAADNQCFGYDTLRRLTQAWTPSTGNCATTPSTAGLGGPAPYWQSWSYDLTGNRTQQIDHATTTGGADNTITYGYPAPGAAQPHAVTNTSGAVTGTYQYDPAGQTTCRPTAADNTCPAAGTTNSQIITWDPEGHVASSADETGQTSYLYDADGNRLIRTDPGGKTLYLPGEELRYTTATGLTCTRYYTFNGMTIASRTATGLTWLVSDHHGTAQIAVDSITQTTTARRQTPFGTTRGTPSAWPNSQGFVGGTEDNTALTHLGAREYDPTLGKFLSVDPLFDKSDPQSMNNYAYAGNSPPVFTDPAGTCIMDEDTRSCVKAETITKGPDRCKLICKRRAALAHIVTRLRGLSMRGAPLTDYWWAAFHFYGYDGSRDYTLGDAMDWWYSKKFPGQSIITACLEMGGNSDDCQLTPADNGSQVDIALHSLQYAKTPEIVISAALLSAIVDFSKGENKKGVEDLATAFGGIPLAGNVAGPLASIFAENMDERIPTVRRYKSTLWTSNRGGWSSRVPDRPDVGQVWTRRQVLFPMPVTFDLIDPQNDLVMPALIQMGFLSDGHETR